ncbi:MAG: hypothetical protein IPM96_16045 [Ignavibacteria bacterium]|nr:hypothetical protein [Ignavibacteria bacterium]
MQYSFKVQILKRESESDMPQIINEFTSARWYDRVFRAAMAVIWAMEELKDKYRGKE